MFDYYGHQSIPTDKYMMNWMRHYTITILSLIFNSWHDEYFLMEHKDLHFVSSTSNRHRQLKYVLMEIKVPPIIIKGLFRWDMAFMDPIHHDKHYICLSHFVNPVTADDLATQGARASAAVVLT